MIGAENVRFEATSQEGDPGKLAYLHNKDWKGKPFAQLSTVDPRGCPGCMFPGAPEGKWPHLKDFRCEKFVAPIETEEEREAHLEKVRLAACGVVPL
jgi:hypothetical protein